MQNETGEYAALTGERANAYMVLVRTSERRPLGRRRIGERNLQNRIDGMDRIRDREERGTLVNTVMELRVP